MKSFFQNFLLTLCATFFAIFVAESIARLVYEEPWYDKLLTEQTAIHWKDKYKFEMNSLGIRGQELSSVKQENTHRVLVLGDSFTFGIGVPNEDDVFPAILEQELDAEFSSHGKRVEILNGGIPGSLTPKWVELLQTVEPTFQPDTILIVFFLRDGTRTSLAELLFEPIRNELEAKNADSPYYQFSFLVRLYRDHMDKLYFSNRYSSSMNESYFGNAEQTKEWENAKANILKIKSIADSKKIKIGMVVFPVLAELNENYFFKDVSEEIIRFTTAQGIPTHDLLPAFLGQNGPDLWVSALDQHPNEAAHKIAADSMLPFLRQLIDQQ